MNLLRQLRPFFDAGVRARGDQYDRENRVELESVEPGVISARVEGKSTPYYYVNLSWEDEDPLFLLASCTCVHYSRGEFCKHLWATLRIFEDGLWDLEGGDRQVVLQHLHDVDEDEPGSPVISPGAATTDRSRQASLLATMPPAGAPQRQWTRTLVAASQGQSALLPGARPAGAEPAINPDREMWLLLDPARCLEHGALIVEHYFRQRKRNGEFGKIRREGVSRRDLEKYESEEDRELLGALIGNQEPAETGRRYRNEWDYEQAVRQTTRQIAPEFYDYLLPRLAGTGRLVWHAAPLEGNRAPRIEGLHPLTWHPAPAWEFELEVRRSVEAEAAEPSAAMEGCLVNGDEHRPMYEALAALPDGLLLLRDQLTRLRNRQDASWVNTFAAAGEQRVPAADLEAFTHQWWTLPYRPRATLPPDLTMKQVKASPKGKIRIREKAQSAFTFAGERGLEVSFDYAGQAIPFDSTQGAVVDRARNQVVERDAQAEERLLAQLAEHGVRGRRRYMDDEPWYSISERRVDVLSQAMLDQDWTVELDGVLLRQSTAFDLAVSSGIDWFDLEGEVEFGGQRVDLPALLAARAEGRNHVVLPDGTHGILPEAWLDDYERLAALGETTAQGLRMGRSQATLLDVLLRQSEATNVRLDLRFEQWRERLRNVSGVTPAAEPPGFEGELRTYQRVGLGWLQFLAELGVGGCLADDMGLGKTVQVIAQLLHARQASPQPEGDPGHPAHPDHPSLPSLIVVPRSLVWNWRAELSRFAPTLSVLEYTGPDRAQRLPELADHDVVITTYATLRRDIVELRETAFDYAVLDEAQAIKNARSQVAKASRLINARHRLAISGTPVENHLGELWSVFEFLNPGLLGSAKAFGGLTKNAKGRTSAESAQMLSQALRPFILRRTKAEVLPDLPPKTEQTLYCELSDDERERYDELRDYFRTQLDQRIGEVGLDRAKIHVLEALLRLRQAACHPALLDPERIKEGSAKLETLMERLEDVIAEGHKALVFSQFTKLLSVVREAAEARTMNYVYLDGRTRNREQRVAEFQNDPECALFLISLKAGGHGLNLTAADYVFILDPWWNPAVEAQAVDRAHRLGQTRSVFAYRLIAKDTVEEKIVQLQARKRELADAIVAADESLIRSLTAEDLSLLLG